jgi:RNA polymerase primary sigma factor
MEKALDLVRSFQDGKHHNLTREEELVYGPIINSCRERAIKSSKEYSNYIKQAKSKRDFSRLAGILSKALEYLELMEDNWSPDHKNKEKIKFEIRSCGRNVPRERQILREFQRKAFYLLFPKAITERLIEANRPLIGKIRLRFRETRVTGLNDLKSAGIVGMLEGIWRYDYTTGYRFTTYATAWIENQIRRDLLERGFATYARVPEGFYGHKRTVLRFQTAYLQKHGRYPEAAEICKKTKLGRNEINAVLMALRMDGTLRFEDLQGHLNDTDHDQLNPWNNRILAHPGHSPEDLVLLRDELRVFKDIKTKLLETAKRLDGEKRRLSVVRVAEERILKHEDDRSTLRRVGEADGASRERVRQLQEVLIQEITDYIIRKYPDLFDSLRFKNPEAWRAHARKIILNLEESIERLEGIVN